MVLPFSADQRPPSDAVSAAARDCAHELLARLPELAPVWTEHLLTVEPRLAAGPQGLRGAVLGSEQQAGTILSVFAFGLPASAVELSPGGVTLVRHSIDHGVDLADLLRLYHHGQQLAWRVWSEHITARVADPELHGELLTWCGHQLGVIYAHLREQITDTYRTRFDSATPARRPSPAPADALTDALGEGLIDLDATGSALGCDLTGHHLALALAPLGETDLHPVLTQLADLNPATLITHPGPEGTWWIWLSWPAAPGPEADRLVAALALNQMVVGVGEPSSGRAGFRRSHRQAQHALRTALLHPRPRAGIVRHREVRLSSVLCADPVRARALTDDVLGDLGADSDTCARLRETVLAYLSHGGNKVSTARTLRVHHKTVTYRLDQAGTLLGHPVTDDPLELGAALLIRSTLGAQDGAHDASVRRRR